MPDPKDYDDKQSFMGACMHQVKTKEGKPQDQAVAQCLSMWRNKKKAASVLNRIASRLDNVADTVHKKGFKKEAEEIDILSNTIEAFSKSIR